MERVVIDSNVVVKWFIPEEHSERARHLRNDHLLGCVEATAPQYAILEVYNALRKYHARGLLDKVTLAKIIDLLHKTRISLVNLENKTLDEALEYSLANHVTVHDAYYIVLARSLGTLFYTADDKLLERLGAKEPLIRHLKHYRAQCSPP